MHGPDECAFTDIVFSKVEEVLNFLSTLVRSVLWMKKKNISKFKRCIRSLKNRFSCNGPRRTGDETYIYGSHPMIKKGDMKSSKWIQAYENNNVDLGLKCGFSGRKLKLVKGCGLPQMK